MVLLKSVILKYGATVSPFINKYLSVNLLNVNSWNILWFNYLMLILGDKFWIKHKLSLECYYVFTFYENTMYYKYDWNGNL